MPIDNTTPGNNTGVTDVPIYQDWGPLPFEKTVTKSINIAGNIPSYAHSINIKDVIGLYPQYTNFKLLVLKQYVNTTYPPFIVPFAYSGLTPNDGASPTAILKSFPITQNSNTLDFTMAFQNIGLLNANQYRFKQTFSLQGKNAQNSWTEISFIVYETVLKIVTDLVLFDPKNIVIDHIIGSALPSRDVTFTGNIWNFKGNPKFTLSSTDPNVYIEETTGPDGVYQTAFGNGTGIVKITLTSFFDTIGTEPYDYSYDTLLIYSAGTLVNFVAVRVKKLTTQILTLSPEYLYFSASKNGTEAPSQNLLFNCNVAYVVECSPFITFQVSNILIDGIATQVIIVTPISNGNLDAGLYIGFIKVTATIDGVVTVKTTTVEYEISDIAQFPYVANEISFTLDNKFINLETFNENTYMQMDTLIQAFDFYTDEVKEFSIREKIGLFKGKAKVNIGKTIHQVLSKSKPINENYLQYIPANVQVTFFENNLSDDTTIRTDGVNNLKFVAGLGNNFYKYGFLKINPLPERVTINSFKFLNFFINTGLYKLVIYKNKSFYSREDLDATNGKIATLKVTFEQFTQGDFIEYFIEKPEDGRPLLVPPFKASFIVFPEGAYSNSLIWEDEFLLKQSLECTGTYNLKSNLSFVSQKKYVDLVEQLSYLESNKVARITINTGWLLNTDVDLIESLMRSKKVWINAKGKTIFLVPISDSITNTDSQRELIDYTLEFQINPTYNEETYKL